MAKLLIVTATILCSLLVLGCSDDETTAAAAPGLRFVSDDGPVGPAVYLRAAALSPQHLSLQVVGQDLPDVYGVAFRLEYSGDVLSFDTLAAGDGWGGGVTLPVGREVAPGLVVAAVTLRGDTPGIEIDDVLTQLELPLTTVATTEIQFIDNRSAVVGGDGTEAAGVSWSGGRLIAP